MSTCNKPCEEEAVDNEFERVLVIVEATAQTHTSVDKQPETTSHNEEYWDERLPWTVIQMHRPY